MQSESSERRDEVDVSTAPSTQDSVMPAGTETADEDVMGSPNSPPVDGDEMGPTDPVSTER